MSELKYPKKILLGIQEGSCNLRCPKCYTHGPQPVSKNARPKGLMDFHQFENLVKEVSHFRPRIAPQTWDEPLLNPNFFRYIEVIKTHGMSVTMDTNGLLFNDEKLNRCCDLEIDSIFFSLDAFLPETYQKVRGVNKFVELKLTIEKLLKLRGSRRFPRIGVSFVVDDFNFEEKNDFIQEWSNKVDVVRINEKFGENRSLSQNVLSQSSNQFRTSCWSLEDSLMIHFNGDAALCCVDTHYENKMGNVFTEGVLHVWNKGSFEKARKAHDESDFKDFKICEKCDLWRHDRVIQSETPSLIISSTTTHTYYNRKDRIDNMVQNRFVSQ